MNGEKSGFGDGSNMFIYYILAVAVLFLIFLRVACSFTCSARNGGKGSVIAAK